MPDLAESQKAADKRAASLKTWMLVFTVITALVAITTLVVALVALD